VQGGNPDLGLVQSVGAGRNFALGIVQFIGAGGNLLLVLFSLLVQGDLICWSCSV